jgi:hypothetical protein
MDISENRCSHIRNTNAEEMHHCIRAYLARLRKLSLLGCNPSETLTSVCQSTWRQIPAVRPVILIFAAVNSSNIAGKLVHFLFRIMYSHVK